MTIKTNNPDIFQTLIAQLDKIFRHNRQGSFRTKKRYYEAMKRFCRFLADHYHLQKLANISAKHLTAYVLYMQGQGKSASTIKTELAAIRFFHDKMERTKYSLPSNDELAVELERRRFGQVDRTWSIREFSLFLATCIADSREDYAAIACLTWYAGLRIHECFRIDIAPYCGGSVQHPGKENICRAKRRKTRKGQELSANDLTAAGRLDILSALTRRPANKNKNPSMARHNKRFGSGCQKSPPNWTMVPIWSPPKKRWAFGWIHGLKPMHSSQFSPTRWTPTNGCATII